MISSNNELYSFVNILITQLEREGETDWARTLSKSLTISTLPGEILGEIRINLKKIQSSNIKLHSEIRTQLDEALKYLSLVLRR